MVLYRLAGESLSLVSSTSFAREGLRERFDIQRALRDNPGALGDRLFVIAEEFGGWDDSRRRIDLLALDSSARLVVVELKRSDDESFMDLQAIRYAAMVANMTFDQVVAAHERYLRTRQTDAEFGTDAESRLRSFLGLSPDEPPEIQSARPRIILVSGSFNTELTTSVLWLIDQGVDIACIRMAPYRLHDEVLVDITQVLPLPEAASYLVQLRQKTTESTDAVVRARRERTINILERGGIVHPGVRLRFLRNRLPGDFDPPETMMTATFADPVLQQKNIIWGHNGSSFALSPLTEMLRDECDFPLSSGALNGYYFWALEGDEERSLLEIAEKIVSDSS